MRETRHLIARYRAIFASVGTLLILGGGVTLAPLLALIAYPSEAAHAAAFALPGAVLVVVGALLRTGLRAQDRDPLTLQEGGVIVLLGWLVVIAFSAWPVARLSGLPFPDALFEAVSGWTTTGLSVVDVAHTDHLTLLWRSVMQLAGGAGLAIIMMSSIIGPVGASVASAEGRSDQLVPNVRRSARLVLVIYSAYAVVGTVAYRAAGLSPFDAINQAFAAVSTGGFSTHPDSIGHWNSVAVEAVTIPLMLLGNLSFLTAWLLWRGRLRSVTRDAEVRLLGLFVAVASASLLLATTRALYPHIGKAVRVALFESVSALTTTGYSTVSYAHWNGFGVLVIITLMVVGGGTCSTAGGLKQYRVALLWRLSVWRLRRMLLPRTVVLERPFLEGGKRVFVDDDAANRVAAFAFLYIATLVAGSLVLAATGSSVQDALFEFASALGTVGLSVGVTSAHMPVAAMWAEMAGMFLGRLEFMVIIASIAKMVGDGRTVARHLLSKR